MKLYRFSPIKNEMELTDAIKHIHFQCYKLCRQTFGKNLPNAGNIGVFCHYEDEYQNLIKIRERLTEKSNDVNQKYYRLFNPYIIPAKGDVPEIAYSYLYIRKPDPYRYHVGDVDFFLEEFEYKKLKETITNGEIIHGARIFERADLDMIELFDPDIDALAYVSTSKMTETVRIKQSDATKL